MFAESLQIKIDFAFFVLIQYFLEAFSFERTFANEQYVEDNTS